MIIKPEREAQNFGLNVCVCVCTHFIPNLSKTPMVCSLSRAGKNCKNHLAIRSECQDVRGIMESTDVLRLRPVLALSQSSAAINSSQF